MAGYGYAGILVAFLARQNPLAVIPVAILLGGIGASGGLLQRRLSLPDATVKVLQGMIFVMVLASDSLYGRFGFRRAKGGLSMADPGAIGYWTVPLAVLGGAIRISTPFLFVSLGECLTEKSGRINLGLEGTLVMGAMGGYGVSYLTGSPWLGVLAAGAPARRWARCTPGSAAAARQRHRRRHRADALRRRARVLPRQAADRADGAAAAVDRSRLVERRAAGARGAAHQRAVPHRRRAGAGAGLGAAHARAGA